MALKPVERAEWLQDEPDLSHPGAAPFEGWRATYLRDLCSDFPRRWLRAGAVAVIAVALIVSYVVPMLHAFGASQPPLKYPITWPTTPAHRAQTPPARSTTPAATATTGPTSTVRCQPPTRTTFGFETCLYSSSSLGKMTFYLYVPTALASGAHVPLVLLLHGGGERAQSGNSPAENASLLLSQAYVNAWSSNRVQARWPSIVVVPQVAGDSRFVDEPIGSTHYTLSAQPSVFIARTMAIAEAVQRQYPQIDSGRRYITGISMGAVATWDIIERWPGYFAAAAPISGAGDPALASRLVSLPIWDFHSVSDDLIPVAGSQLMIRAIRQAGGHPQYTQYTGVGHDIWNTEHVYGQTAFLTWLFAQRNPHPATGP